MSVGPPSVGVNVRVGVDVGVRVNVGVEVRVNVAVLVGVRVGVGVTVTPPQVPLPEYTVQGRQRPSTVSVYPAPLGGVFAMSLTTMTNVALAGTVKEKLVKVLLKPASAR